MRSYRDNFRRRQIYDCVVCVYWAIIHPIGVCVLLKDQTGKDRRPRDRQGADHRSTDFVRKNRCAQYVDEYHPLMEYKNKYCRLLHDRKESRCAHPPSKG